MKKAILLAAACVLGMSTSISAQEGATTVPDETQGYLLNDFKSNWFITAEGGANVHFSKHDGELGMTKRIGPAASIYAGKWFSPVLGVRFGVNFLDLKAVSFADNAVGARPYQPIQYGYGKSYFNQKTMEIGPVADVLINLTNWWCGYKPNRFYNASAYVGAGYYWTLARKMNDGNSHDWAKVHNSMFTLRAGLLNQFRLSDRWQLNLDLRASALDGMSEYASGNNKTIDLQAYLGFTYNFGKTTWSAPVVPIPVEPENCDALRARLAAADARISDLEKQLKDCLNRPVEKAVEKGPVATIYYPIGVSRLTREDRNILGAIANVMKSNPNQHYTLTGWADNYTGTEQVNIRLRKARVAGVEKELKKQGVAASQITATTNNGSLCDLGEKYVALDRAVTIEETK